MTDKTAKTTTEARRLEALAVKTRLVVPSYKPTSLWDVVLDFFSLNKKNVKYGDHE